MLRIYENPGADRLGTLLARATAADDAVVRERVAAILAEVKNGGDRAVAGLTRRIDGTDLSAVGLAVTPEEVAEAREKVPAALKEAIALAERNIRAFHAAQRGGEVRVETQPGVVCWQRPVPIGRVGLYIPGGTAPLFSTVLMLAVPAKIAGCRSVVLCTPAGKEGKIAPEILYAADLCGVDRIYRLGGAVAVGAMAYGTESVPKVDKIFGPGNPYVTVAKQMVSLFDTAIDMPAGPSEVMVLADGTADPEFVAADLLSQAEHGTDSQAVLVTVSAELARRTAAEVERQLEGLARRGTAEQSLAKSCAIVVGGMDEALRIVNGYAPEHLIIETADADRLAGRVEAAGSVFIGHYSPESAGDYASGTNHTLPTNGWAGAYSGVNLDSFRKKITYQRLTPDGLRRIGTAVETMAEAEGLTAHRNAVSVRLKKMEP